jgi:hypothetical protein
MHTYTDSDKPNSHKCNIQPKPLRSLQKKKKNVTHSYKPYDINLDSFSSITPQLGPDTNW